MEDTFIRQLDIQSLSGNKTLQLHQKIEGDVSCVVWDAAIILAKYLEKLNQSWPGYFKNVDIIELGAGVGCVGLTAACLGATVLLTDLSGTIPLLELNIQINQKNWKSYGSAEVLNLNWGQESELKFSPDLILLADCIYYKESVCPLIKTLKELARSDTEILLCQELRDTEKQVECWNFFCQICQGVF